MWLEVFGLEPEFVHGNLINEPMHQTRLQIGAQVEVPVAEISDWVCVIDGQPQGNFTNAAIKRAAEGYQTTESGDQ